MEDNNFGLKGFLSFITCKKQVDAMNDCLKHYYKDKELKEHCERIYLERRAKYRATGILEKDEYFKKPYYESERKKEFLAKIKAEKEQKAAENK